MLAVVMLSLSVQLTNAQESSSWWSFQAIDTMKYSRDLAREKLNDASFDKVIAEQVDNIASLGATHVAIATPYDEEFIPILKRWVIAARRAKLNVWFRGNWSGWEKWFDYERITREQHLEKTRAFIIGHPELFEDGDVFSSCPECENGGPGDPRFTGDVAGHRQFLIAETQTTQEAFTKIKKKVISDYHSMNGDVARLVMDPETTAAVGGVVVIDHYVKEPEQLVQDIVELAEKSQGQIVLGEFGAPIPDIHGPLSEAEQAAWVSEALSRLALLPQLHGLSYWVNLGGSTQLWNADGTPRAATIALKEYYLPREVSGTVLNEFGRPQENVQVSSTHRQMLTGKNGQYSLATLPGEKTLIFQRDGFLPANITIADGQIPDKVVLERENPGFLYRLLLKLLSFLDSVNPFSTLATK